MSVPISCPRNNVLELRWSWIKVGDFNPTIWIGKKVLDIQGNEK